MTATILRSKGFPSKGKHSITGENKWYFANSVVKKEILQAHANIGDVNIGLFIKITI
ncbi:hypothetical protein [Acetobacter malorum]|uniref:hypothetical protein n=1 Tax=Acetobacter malorum TaxID=178901 RepID=UPI000A7E2D09|nr:hypothetical protein [Acetobacter malorum]